VQSSDQSADDQPRHGPPGQVPARVSEDDRPVVDEFRANAGKVEGRGDLLLLTATGARDGQPSTVPLAYEADGDRLLIAGSEDAPWYQDVLAHPMVWVELGTGVFGAVAVPAEGAGAGMVVELPPAGPPPAPVTTMAGKLAEIHDWLRGQLDRVKAETDAYFGGDGGRVAFGLQLRQYCLAFCQGLEMHHSGEDAVMLPELERSNPELRPAIARLYEQHHTVARLKDELEALLGEIATVGEAAFRAELDRLSAELLAHLDDEERSLDPVLAAAPFPPRSISPSRP
jgi:hypothetical protein